MLSECLKSLSQGIIVFKPRRVLCLLLAFLLTVQPAMAWSECGHHIIAVLAYDLMKPEQQKRVIELLKHHPRFAEDFNEPEKAKKTETLDHFIIGNAGYWPDIARSQPKYNRPNWHYQLGCKRPANCILFVWTGFPFEFSSFSDGPAVLGV
jgi:hypothetical protein